MLIGFASTVGGCAHYRAELPARALADRGWDTCWTDGDLIFGSQGGMGFDERHVRFPRVHDRMPLPVDGALCPDVIVLAAGWVRAHPQVLEAAERNGQRVLTDCDDWPWLPPENPHAVEMGEQLSWNAGEAKLATMAAASAATVSTPYMKRLCDKRGVAVTVCRNTIDPARYREARDANRRRHDERAGGDLVIAYRGMLCGFHDADVAALRGCLPLEGVRYVHVGADPRGRAFAELAGVPAELVENRQAREFAEYPTLLAGVDLALIPFAQRPFSLAKSAIAGLEWSAAGVPWLAGPHPEYDALDPLARIAKPGKWRPAIAGLTEPAAWLEHLSRQRYLAAAYVTDAQWPPGVESPADRWETAIRAALRR